MKLDEEKGAKDAPAAGAEYSYEEASAGASLQEESGTRGGLDVWKHIVIPIAALARLPQLAAKTRVTF